MKTQYDKLKYLQNLPHPKPLPQGEGFSLPSPSLAEGIKGVGKIILDSAFYAKIRRI
ncbi:hypothetical protein [Helicobacter sp. 23-1045]